MMSHGVGISTPDYIVWSWSFIAVYQAVVEDRISSKLDADEGAIPTYVSE